MSEESSTISPRLPNSPLHENFPLSVPLPSLVVGKRGGGGGNENHVVETATENCNSNLSETDSPRFTGSWQKPSDMAERRLILKEIVRCIRRRRPNAPTSMRKQLPIMAQKMEEALYKDAPSKKAYADLSTLEHRLEELARKVQEKVEAMKKATQPSN